MPRTELFSRLRHTLRVADVLERQGAPTEEALDRALEAWSRRRFLQTSTAAAAGAAFFPAWSAPMPTSRGS